MGSALSANRVRLACLRSCARLANLYRPGNQSASPSCRAGHRRQLLILTDNYLMQASLCVICANGLAQAPNVFLDRRDDR